MTDILITQALNEYLVPLLVAFLAWLSREAVGILKQFLGERGAAMVSQTFSEAMRRAVIKVASESPDSLPEDLAGRAANYVSELMPDTVAKIGATRPAMVERAKAELASLGLLKGGR